MRNQSKRSQTDSIGGYRGEKKVPLSRGNCGSNKGGNIKAERKGKKKNIKVKKRKGKKKSKIPVKGSRK